MTSPVPALSPLVYAELHVPAGASLVLPDEHPEQGLYIVDGALGDLDARKLHVFDGAVAPLRASTDTHVMLIGGTGFPEKRHIWWNFVSSSRDRIERAKTEWLERRFQLVVDDEIEYVPLPEGGPTPFPATGARRD
jgi:hypothetical protein